MSEFYEHFFELIGAMLEFTGALYLANRYLMRLKLRQTVYSLARGILNKKYFESAAYAAEKLSKEDAMMSLRGIAFISVGFLVRSIPHFVFVSEDLLESISRLVYHR